MLATIGKVPPLEGIRPSYILSERRIKDMIILHYTGTRLDLNFRSAWFKGRHTVQCLYSRWLWKVEHVAGKIRYPSKTCGASHPFDCKVAASTNLARIIITTITCSQLILRPISNHGWVVRCVSREIGAAPCKIGLDCKSSRVITILNK